MNLVKVQLSYKRGGKPDNVQKQIVGELREFPNLSVFITSGIGHGFPDLIVGYKDKNYLFEVKNSRLAKDKLRPSEIAFQENWWGQVLVIINSGEILKAINYEFDRREEEEILCGVTNSPCDNWIFPHICRRMVSLCAI